MSFASREYLKRVFLRDRLVLIPLVIAACFVVLNWALMLWRGLPLRQESIIPLHYTIYFGIDLIGPWYLIFLPALVGFLFLILNAIIIAVNYERRRPFSYLFALGTTFIELVLLVGSAFSILINF